MQRLIELLLSYRMARTMANRSFNWAMCRNALCEHFGLPYTGPAEGRPAHRSPDNIPDTAQASNARRRA